MNNLHLDSAQSAATQQIPLRQTVTLAGLPYSSLWQQQQQSQQLMMALIQQEQQRQLQQKQLLLAQQMLRGFEQSAEKQLFKSQTSINLVPGQDALANLLLRNLESASVGQASGFQFGDAGRKPEFQAQSNPKLQGIRADLAGFLQAKATVGNSDGLQRIHNRITGLQLASGTNFMKNDSLISQLEELKQTKNTAESNAIHTAEAMEILFPKSKLKQEENISVLQTEQENSQNEESENLGEGESSEEDYDEDSKESKMPMKGQRSKKM